MEAKQKHTPGPWAWDYYSDGASGLSLKLVSESQLNGSVRMPVDVTGSGPNACLIAAAPEMVAELRRDHTFALDVLRALEAMKLTDLVLYTQAEMRAESLRAAIAKAEGR